MDEVVNVVIDSSSAKRGIDVLVDSVSKLNEKFKSAETATDKFFNTFNSGLEKAERGVLSLRNIAAGFTAIIGVFNKLGSEMSKFQAFISAMSVSVGGVKNARTEYSFLMQMSDRLGVSINSLSHNYSQLAAATEGTGITTDRLRNIFESFSIAARVMHLSTIDTRLMFYALTQMVSKGSVSMEELRRQLGEKLPGAMKIAAKSVGATSDELEAAIRKGIVDPAKFLPIFADAVRETFGPGLALAMKAFDAEMNRMTNSVQRLLVQMYDLGVADSFTRVIKEINRLLNDPNIGDALGKAIKSIAEDFARFLSTITAEDVKRAFTTIGNGLSMMGRMAANALPFMQKMAEYVGLIAGGYAVFKGVAIGAAAGTAVAGPGGTIPGAVVGGVAALGGVGYVRNKFANLSTPAGAGVTKPITGAAAAAAANENLNAQYFGRTSAHTLADVLKASDKNKKTPMDSFIETLQQRSDGTGEEGNRYDGLRRKAENLGKGSPSKLAQALKLIDDMEMRGEEFDPLIRRLQAAVDIQNRETPDAIDREVERMKKKFPNAPYKAKEAEDYALKFRVQYFEKLRREQDAFDAKQTEIIRQIGVEKSLYEEQFQLIGKGADEKERMVKRLDMEKKLEEQIAALRKEAALERRQFDENGFRGKGKGAIDEAMEELRKLQQAKKTADAGWRQSIQDYVDSVGDMATQISNLMARGFKGMEDALVKFVMTGKLSFRDFANSVIEDLTRILVRKAIVGPLASMLMAFNPFGGAAATPMAVTSPGPVMLAHTGGIANALNSSKMVSMDVFAGARRFHGGGIVGGEVPIIAKREEGVFTPEQMRALAPVSRMPSAVSVMVNVDMGTGSVATQANNDEGQMKEFGQRIGQKVREEIAVQMRPGGMLARS